MEKWRHRVGQVCEFLERSRIWRWKSFKRQRSHPIQRGPLFGRSLATDEWLECRKWCIVRDLTQDRLYPPCGSKQGKQQALHGGLDVVAEKIILLKCRQKTKELQRVSVLYGHGTLKPRRVREKGHASCGENITQDSNTTKRKRKQKQGALWNDKFIGS